MDITGSCFYTSWFFVWFVIFPGDFIKENKDENNKRRKRREERERILKYKKANVWGNASFSESFTFLIPITWKVGVTRCLYQTRISSVVSYREERKKEEVNSNDNNNKTK